MSSGVISKVDAVVAGVGFEVASDWCRRSVGWLDAAVVLMVLLLIDF